MRSSKRPRNNPAQPAQGARAPHSPATVIRTEEAWQGPLPSPRTLDEFKALVPDAPERIIAQWEEEARHRRVLEDRALRGNLRTVRVGQYGAIAFGMGGLASGCFCIWMHQPSVAAVIFGAMIAPVVGAFLYQRLKPTKPGSAPPE